MKGFDKNWPFKDEKSSGGEFKTGNESAQWVKALYDWLNRNKTSWAISNNSRFFLEVSDLQ